MGTELKKVLDVLNKEPMIVRKELLDVCKNDFINNLKRKRKEIDDVSRLKSRIENLSLIKSGDITTEMRDLYQRCWLDMDENTFLRRANSLIALWGVGLGSNFVENAIKEGFITQVICDNDVVERQNRSRQAFSLFDIGKGKVNVVKEKMTKEYPFSRIFDLPYFLENWSARMLLGTKKIKYSINAIDFDSDCYVRSHIEAKRNCKLEFFPFVIGQKAVVIVIDNSSNDFVEFFKSSCHEEVKEKIIEYCIGKVLESCPDLDKKRMKEDFDKYQKFGEYYKSDPQTNNAVQKAITLILDIMKRDIRNEIENVECDIKKFPDIYYL